MNEDDLTNWFSTLDAAARAPLLLSDLTRSITARFTIPNLGSWTLRVAPNVPGSVTADDPSSTNDEADCTLTCEKSVLLDLANGRRKFAVAFMKGLLSVRGDKSVFTSLTPLIRAAARDFKAQREARQSAAEGASRALRVTVHGASVVTSSASETFAVYLLEVFEADSRWTIARRWSEVRTLARRLYRLPSPTTNSNGGANGHKLPSLPRSLDFAGSLEAPFLNKRTTLISEYLRSALLALPTSVLPAGAEPMRRFLSPEELGSITTIPCVPGVVGGFTSPNSSSRGSFSVGSGSNGTMNGARQNGHTDVSGFLSPRGSMNGDNLRLSSSSSSYRPAAAAAGGGAQPSSTLTSPPWTTLNAPHPLFTPPSPARTHRVVDVYPDEPFSDEPTTQLPNGNGSNGLPYATPSASSGPVGALLEGLLAAASTSAIHAESNPLTLEQRMAVLSKLRAMEAKKPADTLLIHASRLAAMVLGITWRCLLPASIGVLAAYYNYALITITCLSTALFFLLTSSISRMLTTLIGLSFLLCVWHQYFNDTSNEATTAAANSEDSTSTFYRSFTVPLPPWVEEEAEAPPQPMQIPTDLNGTIIAAEQLLTEAMTTAPIVTAQLSAALPLFADSIRTTLLASPLRSGIALVGCLLFSLVYYFFGRIARVYTIGFGVIFGYYMLGKLSEKLANASSFYKRHEDALWSSIHSVIAPTVCEQIVWLKSVFIKFGQYLGGRADVVPPEWATSLKLLQDDLPACPPTHLRRTVHDEFGKSVSTLFSEMDERPIASASVAQVHIGRLKPGVEVPTEDGGRVIGEEGQEGEKVVLKLQHVGVEPLMRKDMIACLRLVKFARWLNPDFSVMHSILEAWQHEMYLSLILRTRPRICGRWRRIYGVRALMRSFLCGGGWLVGAFCIVL